jgi:hypothetical protein
MALNDIVNNIWKCTRGAVCATVLGICSQAYAATPADNTVPVSTPENRPLILKVEDSTTDADGDPLTFMGFWTRPAHGVATRAADGKTVTYTPDKDYAGADSFQMGVADPSYNEGVVTYNVTMTGVNSAPVMILLADPSANQGGGPVSVPGFAVISPGPADESAQKIVSRIVTSSHPGWYSQQPQISIDGTLTFTLAEYLEGANGASITDLLSLNAKDDGGTADGGVDNSDKAFGIKIIPLDPAVVFTDPNLKTTREDQLWKKPYGVDNSQLCETFVEGAQAVADVDYLLAAPTAKISAKLPYKIPPTAPGDEKPTKEDLPPKYKSSKLGKILMVTDMNQGDVSFTIDTLGAQTFNPVLNKSVTEQGYMIGMALTLPQLEYVESGSTLTEPVQTLKSIALGKDKANGYALCKTAFNKSTGPRTMKMSTSVQRPFDPAIEINPVRPYGAKITLTCKMAESVTLPAAFSDGAGYVGIGGIEGEFTRASRNDFSHVQVDDGDVKTLVDFLASAYGEPQRFSKIRFMRKELTNQNPKCDWVVQGNVTKTNIPGLSSETYVRAQNLGNDHYLIGFGMKVPALGQSEPTLKKGAGFVSVVQVDTEQ